MEGPGEVDPHRLDGKTAIVTGAARGIGLEISKTLAMYGAAVSMADVEPVERWIAEVDQVAAVSGTQVHPCEAEIRSADSCARLVDHTVERFGGVDILVNNAGVNLRADLVSTSEDDWLRVFDTNLNGVFRMCKAAHAELVKSGAGAVVNLASTCGIKAVRNSAAYCVTKAGVIHLTRVLALEWGPDQIRVNAVGPTIVPTDMTEDVRQDPDYVEAKLASIPMARMVRASEVALAVAFLASPSASMINGQTLFVDGGATVC